MDTIDPFELQLLEQYAEALAVKNLLLPAGPHRWTLPVGQSLEELEVELALIIDSSVG